MLGRIQLVVYLGDGEIQIADDRSATDDVLQDLRRSMLIFERQVGFLPRENLQFRVSPEVDERFIKAWEDGISVRMEADPNAPRAFCGIPLETGILER